jgi:cobyric acid synthase
VREQDYRVRREAAIDRLADAVERHLDQSRLLALFGLEYVRSEA